MFGADVLVCLIIMREKREEIGLIKHLLWVLYYMKKYPTMCEMQKIAKVCAASFYSMLWRVVDETGNLKREYVSFLFMICCLYECHTSNISN